MKLRNKKTGEIREGEEVILENLRKNGSTLNAINIEEIKEEWEDVPEEPKEHWFINAISGIEKTDRDENDEPGRAMIEIGNYFNTREEAEKAIEKLKAWQRLKDKGFRFVEGYLDDNDYFIIKAKLGHVGLIDQPDVQLLFGGEE